MKKIILSLVLFAASLTAFADPSARVVISHNGAYVVVRQDATPASYEAFGNPSIVLNVGGTRYSEITAADVEGLALEFIPTAENFEFTFSNVIGDLYLVDLVNNTRTKIENGTFAVTATAAEVAAGAYISDRFAISTTNAPVAIENNVLQFIGLAGKLVKVEDANGAVIEDEKALVTNHETINLSAQPAGRYVLTLDGQKYQFDVRIPEIPEAKYHVVVAQP